MKNRILAISAAALAVIVACSAQAQDISFNGGVTSDYVTRGTSQANHQPSYSAGVDLTTDSGFYVGAWTGTVDFGDGTDLEYDVYGGYRTTASGWGLDFGVASYNYANDPGDGFDMVEALVVGTRSFGNVGTTLTIAYSPDYFNLGTSSVWSDAALSYPLTAKASVSGGVGYQFIENDSLFPSYSTANVGVGYAISANLSADLRYTINDLDENVVGFFADDSVSVGLTAVF